MAEQNRQPSAVTLSAQNLVFAPQNSQLGNVPLQFPAPMAGQQAQIGMPMTVDMGRQAQKMREYEQQRAKLQQLNARGTSSSMNPDAMIAQMLGKPLAPASANRPISHAAPQSSFMYPTSAPPYMAAGRPPMPPQFVLQEGASMAPPSAMHLTPQDLEKMMHHFAGIRMENGKEYALQQGFKPASGMDGVFVIPTMPNMVGPEGHQMAASMASPIYFMPPWTRDKTKVPEEYQKYLSACVPPGRPYGVELPDTGLVYVLLRTSGLSNEILGTIWALTNRSQPGQLMKEEFFAALALVALAQETGTVASLEVLSSIQRPPIPRLQLSALNIPSAPVPAPAPAPAPSVIPSLDRRPSNGIIEPMIPSSAAQAPTPAPAPVPAPVQPTGSADEFGEFTDFQAAPTPVPAPAPTPTPISQDPYEALRALAPVVEEEKKLEPIVTATKAQEENFGDFTTAMPPSSMSAATTPVTTGVTSGPVPRSRTEPKMGQGFAMDVVAGQKKDLNELLRQTFESLDLGGGGGLGPGSGPGAGTKSDDDSASIRSESKEPSVHSLDLHSLKHFDMEQPEAVESSDIGRSRDENHVMRSPAGSISLVDRYAAFRENGEHQGESATVEKHVDAWTRCLEACLQLLKQAEDVFSRADDDGVRKEILATERGSKYLCGNVQIYRVSRRIRLSLQTMAFQTDKLIDLITDIDAAWANLCRYVDFSGLLPKPEDLDFRNAVVPPSGPADERRKIACCGVCLLNVDATCKTDHGTSFDYKLTYGGRQYHAQCANLWINCIDSVLPALEIPCLL